MNRLSKLIDEDYLRTVIDKDGIRKLSDYLSGDSKIFRAGRVMAKAILFQKRIIKNWKLIFEGIGT